MQQTNHTRKLLRLVLLAGLTIASPAWAVSYTLTDLGDLGFSSRALGINNNGQIVGDSFLTNDLNNEHAFLYSNGIMRDLGTLGGLRSDAYGINDNGQVVGYSYNSNNSGSAFLYSNGTMNALPSWAITRGNSINNAGQIAGTFYTAGGDTRAALYSNRTTWSNNLVGNPSSSDAKDINNNGQVVGEDGVHGAFLYSNGTISSLGGLGYASAINDNGQVVGGAIGYGGTNSYALLYSNGTVTDLGSFGGAWTEAHDINNSGQVVGFSDASSGPRAFLYSGGQLQDLNTLVQCPGCFLEYANAINDLGQIVGEGIINGHDHAFLLTPIVAPLPATAWLFGSGLLGLIGVARRKTS